jgi:hypothetical protein
VFRHQKADGRQLHGQLRPQHDQRRFQRRRQFVVAADGSPEVERK